MIFSNYSDSTRAPSLGFALGINIEPYVFVFVNFNSEFNLQTMGES